MAVSKMQENWKPIWPIGYMFLKQQVGNELGGSTNRGFPKMDGLSWKIPLEWMTIVGNPHLVPHPPKTTDIQAAGFEPAHDRCLHQAKS